MDGRARLHDRVFRLIEAATRLSDALVGLPRSQWESAIHSYLDSIGELGRPATPLTDAAIIHCVLCVLEHSAGAHQGGDGPEIRGFLRTLCDGVDADTAAAKALGGVVASLAAVHANPEEDLIQRAREYIRANVALPLTVREVARQVACSAPRLEQLFRRYLNFTVHQYIANVKMARAAALIASGEKVLVAMLLVGYRGKSSFGAQFKRRTGFRPGEYRLRQAGEDMTMTADRGRHRSQSR